MFRLAVLFIASYYYSSLPSDDEDEKLPESQSTMYETKLCEISSQVTGIVFKNNSKKWLHDDIYLYTAKVETKTVSFNLELRVHIKVNKYSIITKFVY